MSLGRYSIGVRIFQRWSSHYKPLVSSINHLVTLSKHVPLSFGALADFSLQLLHGVGFSFSHRTSRHHSVPVSWDFFSYWLFWPPFLKQYKLYFSFFFFLIFQEDTQGRNAAFVLFCVPSWIWAPLVSRSLTLDRSSKLSLGCFPLTDLYMWLANAVRVILYFTVSSCLTDL